MVVEQTCRGYPLARHTPALLLMQASLVPAATKKRKNTQQATALVDVHIGSALRAVCCWEEHKMRMPDSCSACSSALSIQAPEMVAAIEAEE